MARLPRERSNTGIYHIMLRGVNKQNIFEDDEDRFKFLEILKHFKGVCKYDLYAYCLMSNHIHILLKEREDSVSVAIKRISSSYVLWYNKKYKRSGHLFQERFKSETVNDDEYFIRVLRYIHQNPIKAGMVNTIARTKWTSHFDYITKPYLTDVDFALDLLSTNREKSIDLYKKYMAEDNNDEFLDSDDYGMISDDVILDYLKNLGVSNVSTLQQMDRSSRNAVLKEIKSINNASLRQISRITGISKSVIGRI